jgi:hypothetical protein
MPLSRLAWLCALPAAMAQTPPTDGAATENVTPPPLRVERLIEVEMPGRGLRYGVEPASVTVTPDGVVRYVVVAASDSGLVNAMYEGIRCSTAEVKVYARHHADTGWKPVAGADWQTLYEPAQRHSLVIARNGVCMGRVPNGSVPQIVRDLAAPMDRRFRPEFR